MSLDPMTSISAIKQLAASLSGLGAQLSGAAKSGTFDAVLSQVNAEMTAVADGGQPVVTSQSGSGSQSAAALAGMLGSGYGSGSGAATQLAAASYGSGLSGLSGLSGQAGLSGLSGPGMATGSTSGAAPVSGQAVVADARQYLGVPYQWGGTNPATGLDCSGLVQRVYSDLGISLPRTSQEQATVGTPVAGVAAAQPGDLVFYEPSPSGPGHVGIYIGNGQIIDAPHTGTVVRVDPVGTPSAIRRVLPSASPTAVLSAAALGGTGSSSGMTSLGVPASLQPLFAAAGQRYGIDPLLLASVAKQESGFQTDAVSGAGAQGLMQLMPGTAAGLGVSPFDPASAIDGAAQLLSGYLHDYGGSVPMALAAYNAGPGAVAAYGGVPPYPETEGYVSNITSMLASAQSGAGVGAPA